jgi:hypothetical protein
MLHWDLDGEDQPLLVAKSNVVVVHVLLLLVLEARVTLYGEG